VSSARAPRFLFFPALAVGLATSLLVLLPAPVAGAGPGESRGAAATENEQSTRAAIEVLEHGGTAADAAVAAALTAGVVSPSSSGLGGGGFAMVLRPGEREPTVLDFREVAPSRLQAAALERRPLPAPERGHLIGTPGEARGLFELARRFGKRPWAELVAPAERRARQGYLVSPHLARMLAGNAASELAKDPGLASVFFPGKTALVAGRSIKNPKLAATLRRLAAEGPPAIYDGVIAAEIVRGANAIGSALAQDDLTNYAPRERQAMLVDWEGYQIYTMPPPSAGGLLLAETLGMLTQASLERLGFRTGSYQHVLAEVFRAAFVDRFRYIGDPDFSPADLKKLLAPQRLAERFRRLSRDRTHALPLLAQEEHGTHHMVIADREGMVVSLTTTVNRTFGVKLMLPDSGIVLNDELDDFTAAHDAEALGIAHCPNLARPGVRPVSSMTPTIVLRDGKPVLALGGSGGMAISTNVTQVLLARLAFGVRPQEAVSAPRFIIPTWNENTMMLDDSAPRELIDDLTYRGERLGKFPLDITGVQLLARGANGWEPAADPRKHGSGLTARP
jgi:gamma-glutamyltranspeptidase/glutathione hydrolase